MFANNPTMHGCCFLRDNTQATPWIMAASWTERPAFTEGIWNLQGPGGHGLASPPRPSWKPSQPGLAGLVPGPRWSCCAQLGISQVYRVPTGQMGTSGPLRWPTPNFAVSRGEMVFGFLPR